MTVQPRALLEGLQLATGVVTQYTAPANTRTIIDKMTATNTTGAAVTFTVYLVQNGGAANASSRVISAQSVAAGTPYLCPEAVGHILNPGDFIATEASAGASISMRISGREVS